MARVQIFCSVAIELCSEKKEYIFKVYWLITQIKFNRSLLPQVIKYSDQIFIVVGSQQLFIRYLRVVSFFEQLHWPIKVKQFEHFANVIPHICPEELSHKSAACWLVVYQFNLRHCNVQILIAKEDYLPATHLIRCELLSKSRGR